MERFDILANVNEQIGNLPKQQKYDFVRKDYAAIVNWYDGKYDAAREFQPQLRAFITALPQPARVLDVASGTGKETAVITQSVDVTALDISPEMLERLHERNPQIPTVVGNM